MEGEVVAAIVQVLVQNLIDQAKNEYLLVRGLKKEAAKLTGRLGTLQKFLNDAEKHTNPGDAVQSWLSKLEDVGFDADNVLDEFNYHLLSKANKPIKPMKQKVLSCFSPCVNWPRSRKMAVKIKEINENLESINKEAADLGLKEMLVTDVPTVPDATLETDSFTRDPIFVGRDELVLEIVEVINTRTTTDELVSILAIVGMGGLGKTTLTRKVFHLLNEKKLFGSQIWVYVSQIFDPIVLLKKILKELAPQQVEAEMSKQDILKNLQEALKDKKYLFILDNVWNEDLGKWEGFINSLLGVTSTNGNAIVITTRGMEVASTVSAFHTYQLKGLSKEDCWSIIKEKTFGKEDVPSRFEAMGTEIAEKCKGLPLAANVVGGVLRNKPEEYWRSIKENWLSRDGGGAITEILKISFDNLSLPSLKKCFVYCSIFPKGWKMTRHELIEYWMAEGFLVSNDMESVGENFINVLVQNSLLQIEETHIFGYEKILVMHDHMHDLASSVLDGSQSPNADGIIPVRYMFYEERSSDVLKQNAKYLRTLLSMDNMYGNMFSDFESLHVLTFGSNEIEELPSSIMNLIHLRVLDINGSSIEYLPDWIGKLVHLQTLRALTRYLKQLPSTVKYLTKLRHLYIGWNVELSAEIGRLISLQALSHFKVGDRDGWKIEELGSLNGLKGRLEISNLEKVNSKEEAEKANLSDKSKLLDLLLRWDGNREGEITKDEKVLEGLQPHSNLKKLRIQEFKGKRLPSWTQKMEVEKVGQNYCVPLNNLTEIILVNCSECEEIPMFGQLPNLEFLQLEGLRNVKSINSSFYGLEKGETHIVFPALKILRLISMDELTEWAEVESETVFPHLQYFSIDNCPKLKGFPRETIGSSLESLALYRMSSLENLPGIKECLNLKELIIKECLNLKELITEECPNLKELTVEACRNIKDLDINVCPNLKELIITKCPNLEWVGVEVDEQPSKECLEWLKISNCNALQYFPFGMLGASLVRLELVNISSLNNVPGILVIFRKSPHIKNLIIIGVPQLMTTYFVEIPPSFRSLEFLLLDVSLGGSMEAVEALLQACRSSSHSLLHLHLKGIQVGWENLVKSLQHFTALEGLRVETIGMEKLPQWLRRMNVRRSPDVDILSTIEINGEKIWMSLTELCTLLNSDSPDGEEEEAAAQEEEA